MTLLYQTNIINTIEELSPPNDLEDNLKYFVKNVLQYFKLSKEINYSYILGLLENQDNNIVYYNLNSSLTFNIDACSSAIIYNVVNIDNQFTCYILMLTTIPKYRKNGYAKKILDEFAADMKNTYGNIKLVLSATDDSFSFYEKNDFVLIEDDLIDHPILAKHEKYDNEILYYIFERVL